MKINKCLKQSHINKQQIRTENSKRNSQVNKNNPTEHKQSIKVLVVKI